MKSFIFLQLLLLTLGIVTIYVIIVTTRHGNNMVHDLATIHSKPAIFTVSYVTSFWAKNIDDSAPNPHRREVEAALMANIHNPYFDQVVVFLDGVSEESNCIHFLQDMRDIDVSMGLNVLEDEDSIAKVTCVDVPGSQPHYYGMFSNAVSDYVLGDVVVMSNADQAFDYSISAASSLNPNVLAVLGTRGFSDDIPHFTRYFYRVIVGTQYFDNVGQGEHPVGINICSSSPYSWDTFIFHKNTIKAGLKESYFLRPNTKNEQVHFYMNENGAENAALWALQQSFQFKSLYNACDVIHSWHFHLTPKTHKTHATPWKKVGRTPRGSVPYPWGGYAKSKFCFGQKCRKSGHPIPNKNPPCVAANDCFLKGDTIVP